MTDADIIADILRRYGEDISVRKIRREYNIGYGRAKRIKSMLPSGGSKLSVDMAGDTASISYAGSIRTLDELLAAANVDSANWNVKRYSINSWEGPTKNGISQFFQVKAELVRSPRQIIEEVFSNVKIEKVKPPVVRSNGDRLFVLSPADVHFGKYAWHEETGVENYDVDIAKKLFMGAVDELLGYGLQLGGIERFLFIVGNDLIHVDNGFESTTTAGTRQDTDGRWQKAFRAALECVVKTIDAMASYAPVDVVIQPGNHDQEKSQVLGIALEMRYEGTEQVKIINTPRPRRYYKYGNTLLGITHGDGIRIKNLPGVMAKEARELWGSAKYTEWLIGHYHKKHEVLYSPVVEEDGTRIRVIPSLTPPDAWHARKGYSIGIRASEALVYSKDRGFLANFSSTI